MRHHIVQEKYIRQWCSNQKDCQAWIHTHSDEKTFQKGPGWRGFWREDFNIYDQEGEEDVYYLPEDVTARIDNLGLTAIKNIEFDKQFEGYQRCHVAFYAALQYVRTPKFREDSNAMVDAQTKHWWRLDTPTPDDVRMTREDILKEEPVGKKEQEMHEKVKDMTDEEFKQTLYESIHGDDVKIQLTNAGHSKQILKVDKYARSIFDFKWTILLAPTGTNFITSDSPCFSFAYNNRMPGAGLCSHNAITVFPLSPSICLWIDPSVENKNEHFVKLSRSRVRDVNQQILKHSNDCVVAIDKSHLERLTKNYKHTKSREVTAKSIGPYTLFS
jgi:hypothetical protein